VLIPAQLPLPAQPLLPVKLRAQRSFRRVAVAYTWPEPQPTLALFAAERGRRNAIAGISEAS